ncbi:quinon protein alcohol dehydrogenase-like superfamily [Boletus coccyginus]|nr:quinon protein alcohol dehydrogenase-like superfamily [Boletus coccyginus]
MSRVTPLQRPNNDGPQPHPVLSLAAEGEMDWLEYLPDDRRIVIGSGNGTVRVWNLESGEQEGTSMRHEGGIFGLAVTRDGAKIISSGCSGRIEVWDVESHKLVKEWTQPERYPMIAISPEGLVAVGHKSVGIYTMEGRQVNSVEGGKFLLCMCFSPDGNKLACATTDDIRMYDVNSGRLILGPLDGFVTVLWSRDGSRLFSSSFGRTIRCWNSDTGQEIGRPWTGHTDIIRSLSLSPDGSVLASASVDKTVRFWNATTGDPIGQHLRHDPGWGYEWNGMAYLWRLPWLNSADCRTNLVNLGAPRNTVRCPQVSFLNPPPYSTHTPSAEKELDFGLGLLTTAVPITSTTVPNTHPNRPIPNPNPDENDSLNTSSMSNEADLQYVLTEMSLGLEERQRLFESRLRDLVDLATSNGLHVPHDLVRSILPLISRTELVESCHNLMHATDTEPSTSVFHSTSNANHKKMRKIDEIKQKLIAMLREIGFRVPKDRLPWSTLEGELEKRGYTILHWPQGVSREKDKGVYSLGAEEADKLYRALFLDERRVQFVYRDDENGQGTVSLPDLAHSDDALESHHACMPLVGKPRRFITTTQEAYSVERPHKRPRRARGT